MNKIENKLSQSPAFFSLWCIVAAFGVYFCMYAFRKPFAAGLYTGYSLWGMGYKTILIIAQVFGYMLSKFIGIKVIAELKAHQRIWLIIALILFAEMALLCFGLSPFPYNFIFLFINGLPLGMVWGVVYSFLEGRKYTEFLIFGLNINTIISSGIFKTIYLYGSDAFNISMFWLPFFIGLLFLPLFLFFVWMLSLIPPPTTEDVQLRSIRLPMEKADKLFLLRQFGVGLICLVIPYLLMTVMRDFRDNFAVEIWNVIEPNRAKNIFAKTELAIGLIVLIGMSLIALIKNHLQAFKILNWLMIFSVSICGISTLLFQRGIISPFIWMLCNGVGFLFPYLSISSILFDRLIAMYKLKANAGFLIYICDSIGYLGSVAMLLGKEFFWKNLSWSTILIYFSYSITVICVLCLFIEFGFFRKKLWLLKQRKIINVNA